MEAIGNYELLEKIAEGGMGSVYRALDRDTESLVAIKVVPAHLAKNTVLRKRFEQEYNAAHLLNHPNIVRALEFGYCGESPYLVMEFVEGETLGKRLEREGRIPEQEAIKLITQIAQGLEQAHRHGMVHRDVKPDNILVTPDGEAKLADLGLVKEIDADLNLTRTGRGLGTPYFMAPEQFRNAKYVDSRCDIYSLGATLYMMITGELPFRSLGPLDAWMKKVENKLTPARVINKEISERTDWAIRRAMLADPIQRPATCYEFIEDLIGRCTKPLTPVDVDTGEEVWYLRYTDEDDVSHTVKGNLSSIRRSLREGLLGDAATVRASRDQAGPFSLLKKHPEFRDVVLASKIEREKPKTPSKDRAPKRPQPRPVAPQPPGDPDAEQATASNTPTPAAPEPPANSGKLTPVPTLIKPDASADQSGGVYAPLINFADKKESSFDGLRMFFFLAIAAIAGVTGFFLLPYLTALFE